MGQVESVQPEVKATKCDHQFVIDEYQSRCRLCGQHEKKAYKIAAYKVRMKHGDVETIVFAVSAARARWIAVSGAREAGYHIPWSGVSSRRAKEFDPYFHHDMLDKCFDSSCVYSRTPHFKS